MTLNTLEFHEGKYRRACTHSIQRLHRKTRANISNEDVGGEAKSCKCMNFLPSHKEALCIKKAVNSMIKGLFYRVQFHFLQSVCKIKCQPSK